MQRKDFLIAGAAGVALTPVVARAAAPDASASPAPEATMAPLTFDLATFDAATSRAAEHRNAYASVKIDGGVVLDAVNNTLKAYAFLKIPASSVLSAVVLYHGASVMMGFNDALWTDLFVPSIAKAPKHLQDDLADYTGAKNNPFLRPGKDPDAPSIEQLVKAGTLFYVCNNAAHGFAMLLGRLTKQTPASVYGRLVAGLAPGVVLVPAGVWAIQALQERHFTTLQTTL